MSNENFNGTYNSKVQGIREEIDKILKKRCKAQIACPYNYDCENHPDCFAVELDQILPFINKAGWKPKSDDPNKYITLFEKDLGNRGILKEKM